MPDVLQRSGRGARRLASVPVAVMVLLPAMPAIARDTADARGAVIARGVLIYYAVLPAGLIRSYPVNSPERRMHGGVSACRRMHHLLVALFDAATNALRLRSVRI